MRLYHLPNVLLAFTSISGMNHIRAGMKAQNKHIGDEGQYIISKQITGISKSESKVFLPCILPTFSTTLVHQLKKSAGFHGTTQNPRQDNGKNSNFYKTINLCLTKDINDKSEWKIILSMDYNYHNLQITGLNLFIILNLFKTLIGMTAQEEQLQIRINIISASN